MSALLRCKKESKKSSNSKNNIIPIITITKLSDWRCRVSSPHTDDMAGGAILAVRVTVTDMTSRVKDGRRHISTKVGHRGNLAAKKTRAIFQRLKPGTPAPCPL